MEAEWVGESGRRRLRLEGAVELCPVIRHRTATTYISSYPTLCGKTVIHEQQQVYHVESHPSFSKSERKRVRISSPLLVLKRPVSSPTGNLYKQMITILDYGMIRHLSNKIKGYTKVNTQPKSVSNIRRIHHVQA